MTSCPACQHSISSDALICPVCGVPLTVTSLPTAALPPFKQREATRLDGVEQQSRTSGPDSTDGARFAPGTMLTERYRIVTLLGRGGWARFYTSLAGQPLFRGKLLNE